MPGIQGKRFEQPDEIVELPLMREEIVVLGEVYVARVTHQPGWSWAEHVRPVTGTSSCLHHHQGYVVSGCLEFETDTGARRQVTAGEVYDVPPGHNGWVVGDEPAVAVEFAGVRGWGKPPEHGERIVATLLVTDIVDSTAVASQAGDAAWKVLLGRHSDRVRLELDRFRGIEIATTGDGFLAMFDGAARAILCAEALCRSAEADGLRLRSGVHAGEVERTADNLRGVAVHATTRVASLAEPGQVLVSASAAALLEGSAVELEDAGEHELKGLGGRRRVFRLVQGAPPPPGPGAAGM